MISPIGEAVWGEEELLAASIDSAGAGPASPQTLEAGARRRGSLPALRRASRRARPRRARGAPPPPRLHAELGLESRWLRGSECRELEPGLTTAVTGGYVAPGEAEVDPRALLDALRAAVRAAGVGRRAGRPSVLIEGGVAAASGSRTGASCAPGGVLAATGARLEAIVLPAEARPPVRPVKGEVLRLRARRASARASGSSRASASTSFPARATTWSSARRWRTGASTCASPRAASTSCCERPTGRCRRWPSSSCSSARRACGRRPRTTRR